MTLLMTVAVVIKSYYHLENLKNPKALDLLPQLNVKEVSSIRKSRSLE